MSNLQHIKGSRTRVLNTFPTKTFGNDGDIVISRINGKGVFLCSKAGGMWYVANQMQELSRIGKASIKDLSTGKLTVNSMVNARNGSDRYVINDKGSIKYRTGEQIIGDLPLPFNNIDYKTAYCSLGQYSDKDTCESNGGTWYYSENDSHDSISSTAENQLLTVGQSIGGVDAESTLTYDGSTLDIKYNSDYDDNWQTSATTNLLKLSYDSSNNAIFNVSSSGRLTIDCTNDITLDADGGDVYIKDDGHTHFLFDCNNTSMTIYDDADAADLFSITVGASGVTTMATVDDGATVGHLTLDADGDIILDAASGITKFYLAGDTDDLCTLTVAANGVTTIATADSDGESGDLILDIDGDITIDADGGSVDFEDGGTKFARIGNVLNAGAIYLYSALDNNDYCLLAAGHNGILSIATVANPDADTAHITISPNGDLSFNPSTGAVKMGATDKLYFDGGTHTYITESSADVLDIYVGAVNMMKFTESTVDQVQILGSALSIDAAKKLMFDGSAVGHTYISESSDDVLDIKVGGDMIFQITESGDDGNTIDIDNACIGFTRNEATFSATGIIGSGGTDDTDIDFRFSNKYRLEMTGDITTINLIFPAVSGNFLLVCTTNGDHDVTNWKAWEFDESAATTADVLWAGGSVPAFTSSGVDVVSFYWDSTEQQAYGVASLAFATP